MVFVKNSISIITVLYNAHINNYKIRKLRPPFHIDQEDEYQLLFENVSSSGVTVVLVLVHSALSLLVVLKVTSVVSPLLGLIMFWGSGMTFRC